MEEKEGLAYLIAGIILSIIKLFSGGKNKGKKEESEDV